VGGVQKDGPDIDKKELEIFVGSNFNSKWLKMKL
jgi:hypothetical protein